MHKSLVIVESPAKARTIKRYLGKNYEVEASMGHIKDLPKTVLGIDLEHAFQPSYKIKPEKKDIVKKLRQHAASSDVVFLASDPDREGEAIAWHIAEEIKKPLTHIRRIIFHEITKKAIEEAINAPKELNRALYDAQMARRAMDRIVGYTMSPLLWRKVKRGLSGGRVQSVALKLICLRQEEIETFVSQEYWTIETLLKTRSGETFSARVSDPKEIPDELRAAQIEEQIRNAQQIRITKAKKQRRLKHPLPPFITSTLQQASSGRLKFSAKKTMTIAQQLYEGVPIGGNEITGLITYMRTDSPTISNEALQGLRDFIPSIYGSQYLPEKPRFYKAKKSAQEAHEAIRPTSLANTPELLKPHLNRDQQALYELIWKRFIASQMKSAEFEQTTIDISADEVGLRANGSVMKFEGFLKVYDLPEEGDTLLPENLQEGNVLSLEKLEKKQHFTQPPPRYTEASLIKELEDKGIGRPSTYAPTISTILDRGYVQMDGRALVPTELGRDVNHLLVKHYPNILDIGFTARMEDSLDRIEEGTDAYDSVMTGFYETYSHEHERAKEQMENLRAERRPSGLTCEKCGRDLLIKLGKNGYFLGCSGYPECMNTREYTRDETGRILLKEQKEPEVTEIPCEKCGAPMVLKHGKFGEFLACSNYPACKNTQATTKAEKTERTCDKCGSPLLIKQGRYGPFLACSNYPKCKNILPYPLGLKCPIRTCDGEIVRQRSKRGKIFYACSKKECGFISWTKPIARQCPKCSADFLVRKDSRALCPNPDCDHEEAL